MAMLDYLNKNSVYRTKNILNAQKHTLKQGLYAEALQPAASEARTNL